MIVLGFHLLDLLIILIYLFTILFIGKRVSRKIHSEEDFFLAGRSLNKFLQFFLNLGTLTDANSAIRTASFTFNKGVGGVWLMLSMVFTGPYYWFMAGWFRRLRLVTMAELFQDRFRSRLLASLYAFMAIWLSILIIGIGYKASLRTFQAITLKPAEKYTAAEIRMQEQYQEYRRLDSLYREKRLEPPQAEEYKRLSGLYSSGQLQAHASYTRPFWFYLLYTFFIGTYIILGGFKAAAVTDTIQGVLIILFSVILIPLSLVKLGGWAAFANEIPDHMLYVFGSGSNEFAWNSIAALALVTIVGITGHQGNMNINGAARDELTARTASIGGAYTKRILTILWALCGLFAYALYRHSISDPDMAWGVLSHKLLGPGLRGIMITGILAANMSTLDAVCVYLSALFVRHLYKPLVRAKSQRHYVNVSRVTILGFLLLGILVSVTNTSVIEMVKALPSLNIIFGAPVLLMLFWRRLTLKAVYAEVIVCFILFALLPHILPLFGSVKLSERLTRRTEEQTITRRAAAHEGDVQAGLAERVGQKIAREVVVPPAPVYYDSLALLDPMDEGSPRIGVGRLNTELIIADWLGFDLPSMLPSTLLTLRYLVALILPFLILIPVSCLTQDRGLEETVDRFYVKMRTPVDPDPDKDREELEKSFADPSRFKERKLFPDSSWEFRRWSAIDTWGFLLCCGLTAGIIFLFWELIEVIAR